MAQNRTNGKYSKLSTNLAVVANKTFSGKRSGPFRAKQVSIKFDIRSILHQFMQIILSLCFVGVALTVILHKGYDPSVQHWAFATLGMILGFWFKR
jgi:hypothetical protein